MDILLSDKRLGDVIFVIDDYYVSKEEPQTRNYPGCPAEFEPIHYYVIMDGMDKNNELHKFINGVLKESINSADRIYEANVDLISEKAFEFLNEKAQSDRDDEASFLYEQRKEREFDKIKNLY